MQNDVHNGSATIAAPPTLLSWAARADVSPAATTAISAAAVLFITALTAAAAQVSVPLPFTPVPFTFQPMIVLLGGAALGPIPGLISQLLYLVAGAAGWPVFAASPVLPQGALRLIGPTGGYLMSYPVAAFVTGLLAARGWDRRYLTAVLAMSAGLAIVFTGGVLSLAVWNGVLSDPAHAPSALSAALRAGCYPFILADIVKLLMAAWILPALWKLTGLRAR